MESLTSGDVGRFGVYLAEEKHSSQNTVSSYLRDVNQFADYLYSVRDCLLREADSAMVQDYMDYTQNHGKSAASVTRFLASVKAFYNFLISEGTVTENGRSQSL